MGVWQKVAKAVKEIHDESDAYHGMKKDLVSRYSNGGDLPDDAPGIGDVLESLGIETPSRDLASSDDNTDYMGQLGAMQGVNAGNAEAQAPPSRGLASDNSDGSGNLDLKGLLQSYLQKQGAGSDSMQALADLHKKQLATRGSAIDWTPLNKLSDLYWGSNFSKDYKAPPKPDEQTEAAMKDQEAVNKDRQPMLQDLIRQYGIDTNAGTKAQAMLFKTQSDSIKRGVASDKADTKLDTDSLNKLNGLKEYQAAQAQVSKAPGLLRAIDEATDNGDGNPPNQLARQALATELGVYTSSGQRLHSATVDAMGFKSGGALLTRLNQMKEDLASGGLSPENAQFAKKFIQSSSLSGADEANYIKNKAANDFQNIHGRNPKWAPITTQSASSEISGGTPQIPPGSKPKIIQSTGEKIWLTPDNKRLPRQ